MAELFGQTVSKTYFIKDGEGQYGKWRMWSFYLEGSDKKFTYFTSGNKPEPFEGMKIGYLKYTEKQDGKYTNYTVDELKVSEEPVQKSEPPSHVPESQQRTPTQPPKVDWDEIAFKKCKFGFLKEAFVPFIKGEILDNGNLHMLEQEAEIFATMSMRILDKDIPDISEPTSTAFNTEEVPLGAYYDDIAVL